jgi:hypothetical protein
MESPMSDPHPIMLIRHAEKPLREPHDQDDGLGARGKRGLSPRGEQRAWKLADYFGRGRHPKDSGICAPRFIFAASTSAEHRSTRPADTVQPLSAALGVPVRDEFDSDPPFDVLLHALHKAAREGPVLISWRYDTLPALARAAGAQAVPDEWPADCFDMIWLLERRGDACRLVQIPQMLMPGDSAEPIRASLPPQDGHDAESKAGHDTQH